MNIIYLFFVLIKMVYAGIRRDPQVGHPCNTIHTYGTATIIIYIRLRNRLFFFFVVFNYSERTLTVSTECATEMEIQTKKCSVFRVSYTFFSAQWFSISSAANHFQAKRTQTKITLID